ncbi:MAG: peptide ABC transporter substrate-binding protein [Halioglobus sp.]
MLHIAGQTAPRVAGVLLIIFIATALLACAQGESNVAAGNRDGVLHIGNGAEPQSLDPHVMSGSPEVRIARALFEGLVTPNPYSLEIEPGVAQRWEFSEDQRVITFFLNTEAKWSNGDPITSQDFVWSLQRALTPAMGNQLAYTLYPILNAEEFATGIITDPNAVGVKALDEYTLEVTLTNPTPYFLSLLASYVAYPVHRPTLEAHGQVTDRFTPWTRPENMVSNGPFTLQDWQLQRQITVVRSEQYWDAANVKLNAVVFHPIESEIAEEKMFRVNQLHYTERVPLNKIPTYRTANNSPYQQAPLLGSYYFVFNTLQSPGNDLRVRQALAMAIDRDTLVNTILQAAESSSVALTPPDIPNYQPPDLIEYNPDAARKRLAEAGYPDGQGWPGLDFIYNSSDSNRKVAVAAQQMWKNVLNIKVTLANQEWKVYLDTINERNFQMSREGWIGGYLDPVTFLGRFITDGGTNRTGFSNTRFDEIIQHLAPTAKTPEQRLQLLNEAETILMQQVPIIPIYTYTSKHLIQPSVKGAPANVLDLINFKYVRLASDADTWNAEE